MGTKLSDTEAAIREAFFEHEMFEPYQRGNAAFGMESILRLEETWAFTPEQLQQTIKKMVEEDLVRVRDGFLFASTAGLIARERTWQKKGKRHPSLADGNVDPKDIILALIRSEGYEYQQSEHPSLTENHLDVYLFDMNQEVKAAALQGLVTDGLIRMGKHIMEQELPVSALTAAGLRSYAQQVAPRLGLKPPATILAPVEPEVLPFNELGLPRVQADNLRYRWQEAERCIEARAWMSANIMLGSILEVVLPDRLARIKQQAMAAKAAPKDRKTNTTIPFERWRLADCIKVAAELGLIDPALTKHANALRETRNLVHPEVQISERSSPDGDITAISKHVVLAVLAALTRSTPLG
jgi:hypothetical protein